MQVTLQRNWFGKLNAFFAERGNTYTYLCIHAYGHVYTYIYTHSYIHTHSHKHTHSHTHTHTCWTLFHRVREKAFFKCSLHSFSLLFRWTSISISSCLSLLLCVLPHQSHPTYVCVHKYILIHIHTHTLTYTYTHMHVYVHTCTCTYTHTHVHVHAHTHIYTHTHVDLTLFFSLSLLVPP